MNLSDLDERTDLAERRKLVWRAIFAGAVGTIGLEIFFLLFGTALGLTTFTTNIPASHTLAVSVYLLVTTLISVFAGSWITGHWGNLYAAEDAWMHGGIMWALVAIAAAIGVGGALQAGSSAGQAAAQNAPPEARSELRMQRGGFSALNDKNFANFVAERARQYGNKLERQPISVSAEDKAARIDPKNIPSDYELQRFVMTEGNMTEAQAKDFLNNEREEIAKAKTDSQRAWEQTNAREVAQVENARHQASMFAWTMTVLAALSLALALGGAHLGWRQRYVDFDDDEKEVSSVPPNAPDLGM
jgi:Kef-type K+ transport system membrane component KefB